MTLNAYQLSKLIPPLYPTYTDEEISIRFGITISEVRQFLKGPIPLTNAAWQEATAIYSEATNMALKKLYNTSVHQINKWSSGNGKDKIKMDQIAIQEVLSTSNSLKEASILTGTPMYKLKTLLPKPEKLYHTPTKAELLAMEGTHAEIAHHFNVSRSFVSKTISTNHKASTPNKIKDWNAVEEYMKANSLTATAAHFNVSPSAICHWRKRNANKTTKGKNSKI